MTGFGKASCDIKGKKLTVEIKTLNSKQTDIYTKINNSYRVKEMEIRSLLSEKLERGKIDFCINIENQNEVSNYTFNKKLALKYFKDLKSFSKEVGMKDTDFMQAIIRMPDVMSTQAEELDEKEWKILKVAIDKAIKLADEFRIHEGKILEKDIVDRIKIILTKLKEIKPFEKIRLVTLKERIKKDLIDVIGKDKIDNNRFEQELIYYIEKLDITEEMLRLKKHCDYFIETIKEPECGKKLGFIAQEISREINTIGSKANDVNIQRIVVQMKDEMEKAKEQLMNIL